MSQVITLDLPDDVSTRAITIAQSSGVTLEQVILNHLKTLNAVDFLALDSRRELEALAYLSDDTLWTIAREQMPEASQNRAQELLHKNATGTISDSEHQELEILVERADNLMLRKAEAASLLQKRGFLFKQTDFRESHE